jgi:hypothetical protein
MYWLSREASCEGWVGRGDAFAAVYKTVGGCRAVEKADEWEAFVLTR